MSRIGIRVQDLFDRDVLHAKVERRANLKNQVLVKIYNRKALRRGRGRRRAGLLRRAARPMVADTSLLLEQMLDHGRTVVLEAGQATLLDVDHGTYPFVTSSSATAGGACTGSGIPPTRISRVIAVIKAYTTRVGEGPFPTELLDDKGEMLRNDGAEFGTTTGRPRRCGWFDAVVGRYATRINGVTDFVLTKLDVLTGLDEMPVCVAYEVDGVRYDELPMNQADFARARAGLRDVPGLGRGHLAGPHARRPAPQLPRLRRRAGEDDQGADLGHRRRPGPRRDDRGPRPAGLSRDRVGVAAHWAACGCVPRFVPHPRRARARGTGSPRVQRPVRFRPRTARPSPARPPDLAAGTYADWPAYHGGRLRHGFARTMPRGEGRVCTS